MINMRIVLKGGKGSGHYNHAGRPGKIGGSAPNKTQPLNEKDRIVQNYLKFVANIHSQRIENLILQYGKAYKPQELPSNYKRARTKECFKNAWDLVDNNDELTYVEGYALLDFIDLPIQHAWAIDRNGNVIDNTWSKAGTSYIGIPFNGNFVREVLVETGVYGILSFEARQFFKDGMPKNAVKKELTVYKGGVGSGHRGHAGRPGREGGSLPGKGIVYNTYKRMYEVDVSVSYGKYGPFGDDEKLYKLAREYYGLVAPIDWQAKYSWKILADLQRMDQYERDYGKQGPVVYSHGYYDESDKWVPGTEYTTKEEHFQYIFSQVKQTAKIRTDAIREQFGLPERYEDFFQGADFTKLSINEGYYELQDKLKSVYTKVMETSNPLEFHKRELEYILFEKYYDQMDADIATGKNIDSGWKWMPGEILTDLHKFDVRHAVALGDITPDEGDKLGYIEAKSPQGSEWKELPDILYHATTNSEAIVNDQIRSRMEIGQRSGLGLGGGEDDTISFGDDLNIVKNVERALQEAHLVAKGDITIEDMVQMARDGAGGADRPYVRDFLGERYGYDVGDKVPAGLQDLIDAEKGLNDHFTPEQINDKRWDWYNLGFASSRQAAGGYQDPLFFGTDWKSLAKAAPENFATLVYHPKPGARGYQMGSLSEWRTVGGDVVNLAEVVNYYEPDDLYAILDWDKYK